MTIAVGNNSHSTSTTTFDYIDTDEAQHIQTSPDENINGHVYAGTSTGDFPHSYVQYLVDNKLVGVGEALAGLELELLLVLGESRPQSPEGIRRPDKHGVTDLCVVLEERRRKARITMIHGTYQVGFLVSCTREGYVTWRHSLEQPWKHIFDAKVNLRPSPEGAPPFGESWIVAPVQS